MAIIISGGSRGLGLTLVRHYLNAGEQVATFSRRAQPEIDELRTEARFGSKLLFEPLDAAEPTAIQSFVSRAHDRFETISALINNAGVAYDRVLPVMTDEQITQMLDVNLKGAIVLARECARVMLCQNSGSIVNISSIIAERGFSGLAAYAATKAGLIGMTKSLARELGPRGIRVNAVAPGFLETDMSSSLDERQRNQIIRRTPLGRLGTTDDVVGAVEFLTSDASRFITGQVITVDGGASV